jgi:thioesterase domain-containing protein/acyl carrier protein
MARPRRRSGRSPTGSTPAGVSGELYLGGAGVARGYLNRPELTAARFVAHPFSDEPGARLYRTGDLASWRPDGTIDFLGRTDHQVKVRGFRIELGEIEANLVEHADVRMAVVVVRDDGAERRLVAYVVGATDRPPDEAELRAWLRRSVPDYMVPEVFVGVDRLPLTPNGKIDRRALPAPPEPARRAQGTAMVAPESRDERELAGIWQEVLGLDQPIGITDSFFDLGGNSLLAARLLAAVQRWFHRPIPLTTLFEEPTIAHLAQVIRGQAVDSSSPVVEVNPRGGRPPLFCFSLGLGGILALRHLQPRLGDDQPVIGFLVAALPWVSSDSRIEDIAQAFAGEIRERQPEGPLFLFGHSLGGLVAYELAVRLSGEGREVGLVTMVDTVCPSVWRAGNLVQRAGKQAARVVRQARDGAGRRLFVPGSDQLEGRAVTTLITRYVPGPHGGPAAIFGTPGAAARAGDPLLGWRPLLRGPVHPRELPGDHVTILRPPAVARLADEFAAVLSERQQAPA